MRVADRRDAVVGREILQQVGPVRHEVAGPGEGVAVAGERRPVERRARLMRHQLDEIGGRLGEPDHHRAGIRRRDPDGIHRHRPAIDRLGVQDRRQHAGVFRPVAGSSMRRKPCTTSSATTGSPFDQRPSGRIAKVQVRPSAEVVQPDAAPAPECRRGRRCSGPRRGRGGSSPRRPSRSCAGRGSRDRRRCRAGRWGGPGARRPGRGPPRRRTRRSSLRGRPAPHGAAQAPVWAWRPAASIPASAAVSSLSEVSPEMPTAPTRAPSRLISTPPGTGIRPAGPATWVTAATK